MVAVATLLLLHLAPQDGFDSAEVIFEVVSAVSNVGISTGFVNPGMSPAAKWLFIINYVGGEARDRARHRPGGRGVAEAAVTCKVPVRIRHNEKE
jgi:hypothetical protein